MRVSSSPRCSSPRRDRRPGQGPEYSRIWKDRAPFSKSCPHAAKNVPGAQNAPEPPTEGGGWYPRHAATRVRRSRRVGCRHGSVRKKRTFSSNSLPMWNSIAKITAASRPFLYDFTGTRGSEPVPYRAFLHECCRCPGMQWTEQVRSARCSDRTEARTRQNARFAPIRKTLEWAERSLRVRSGITSPFSFRMLPPLMKFKGA